MTEATQTPKQATTRDFLSIVFRQLWVIVTVFMISVVAVLVVTWRTPTNYESSSRVLVSRGRKPSVLEPTIQVFTWEEEVSSEIETVKSFPVAQRAQKILDQWYVEKKLKKPIRLSPSGVTAGVIGESNVIEISYTSRDAESCLPVTNAVTQGYMDFRRESATVPFVNEFFSREITAVDSEMASVMARREAYYRQTGTVAPPDELRELFFIRQNIEDDLVGLQQKFKSNQQDQAEAERLIKEQDVPNPAFFASLGLSNTAIINDLQTRRNELLMQREKLLPKQTGEHPELKGVNQAIEEIEAQLRSQATNSLSLLRIEAAGLASKMRVMQGQTASYTAQLERIPDNQIALDELDHELNTLRDRYRELVGKEIQARISQATSPDWTVTLFAPASKPVALRTTDYVRLALAPILSLVVGLMLAFFLDSLDHSLKGASDVEEHLGIPVLASLPDTRG